MSRSVLRSIQWAIVIAFAAASAEAIGPGPWTLRVEAPLGNGVTDPAPAASTGWRMLGHARRMGTGKMLATQVL